MTDPITNPLGLDRPEREDDARDGVENWQRFKTYPTMHELLELARAKMAGEELQRVKALRDRMVNKA